MTPPDLGHALVRTARTAIAESLGLEWAAVATHEALQRPAATFVTLRQSGQLRGCIGSIRPARPLGQDVRRNAIAAAFHDPRFAPLTADEFENTSVEVSLLSTSEAIAVANERDLLARLRPGIDGLTLEFGLHRATFLPQVWEALPDPREFLTALKAKAGLPPSFWSPGVTVSRYFVTRWAEQDFEACEAHP
jgi:AmmeMemoRadiSam system protein A